MLIVANVERVCEYGCGRFVFTNIYGFADEFDWACACLPSLQKVIGMLIRFAEEYQYYYIQNINVN